MIDATSTLTDVAFYVGTALHQRGITAVLTGGSAATFYAPAAYQSRDLDFVITVWAADGEHALLAAGFRRDRDCYVHPGNRYPVEFPRGPLAVADDLIRVWSTVHRDDEILHVLTPTDSVRDRLAAFLFWNDWSGLEQALAVASARPDVDHAIVEEWCRRSGHAAKWEVFTARYATRR
jgi:hypothetical protein